MRGDSSYDAELKSDVWRVTWRAKVYLLARASGKGVPAAYTCIGFEPGKRCIEAWHAADLRAAVNRCLHAAGRINAAVFGTGTPACW